MYVVEMHADEMSRCMWPRWQLVHVYSILINIHNLQTGSAFCGTSTPLSSLMSRYVARINGSRKCLIGYETGKVCPTQMPASLHREHWGIHRGDSAKRSSATTQFDR